MVSKNVDKDYNILEEVIIEVDKEVKVYLGIKIQVDEVKVHDKDFIEDIFGIEVERKIHISR